MLIKKKGMKMLKTYKVDAWVAAVLLAVIIAVLITTCNRNTKLKEVETLYSALQDTMKTSINDRGELVSKIEVLETTNLKYFTELESNDVTIKKLQADVVYYKKLLAAGGSVTNVTTETHIDTMFVDTGSVVTFTDSVYPTYLRRFDKQFKNWIKGYVKINKDSCWINQVILNDFTVVIGKEKKGLFKSVPIALITNKNPYTKTTNLRTYQVTVPKRHWLRNTLIGVVIGGVTTAILIR